MHIDNDLTFCFYFKK